MRTAVLMVVVSLIPMAGCLAQEPAPGPSDGDAPGATIAPVLPDNISAEENVVGATPLSGLLATGSCGNIASGTCYRYAFDVTDAVHMVANLTWTLPGNDFDLLLVEDGEVRHGAQELPPGTEATLAAALPAGAYELLVVAFLVSSDTFRLDAVFEAPSRGPATTAHTHTF